MASSTYLVLTLPVLVGFGALAVDYSMLRSTKAELQMAADASALAAASRLGMNDDTQDSTNDPALISEMANDMSSEYTASGAPITSTVVEIGAFDEAGLFTIDTAEGDYVRVTTSVSGKDTILGGVFGKESYDISAVSIAGRVTNEVTEVITETRMTEEWPCLLFGDESMDLNGTFDVTIGGSGEGSICTNADVLSMSGASVAQVDAHPGPGGHVEAGADNFNTELYNSDPMAEEIELDEVAFPSEYASMPSGVKKGSGKDKYTEFALTEDVYLVDGDFSFNNSEVVVSSGATTIFVTGNVKINGTARIGDSSDPSKITIKVIGDGSVTFNGSSSFYGYLYAPESEVRLNGTAMFYGAGAAQSIDALGTNHVMLDPNMAEQVPSGGSHTEVVTEEVTTTVTKIRIVQ